VTIFSRLSPETCFLLTGLLFLAGVFQLALCLYRLLCHGALKRRIADGALFAALLCLCAYLSVCSAGHLEARFPWALLPLLALLVFLHAAAGLRRTYRANLETLSPTSVRQALDNLNAGILFADETGRAVLVNYAMARLGVELTGSYPQAVGDLTDALAAAGERSPIRRVNDLPALYRFPDGRIWRFQTVPLDEPALPGFTQTTAVDMTELFETNAQLERDNAALRADIRRMQAMLAHLADIIPQQEALKLKVRIHNDIGASLIALSDLLENGGADAETALERLDRALVPFGSEYPVSPGTLEAAQRQAADMNAELLVEGVRPADPEAERLIAAAARECVTNCIRHAGGRRIRVVITAGEGRYTAHVTNDGRAPSGPIAEGGGLSALRQSIEQAGGEMVITAAPRFALTVSLPERRTEP